MDRRTFMSRSLAAAALVPLASSQLLAHEQSPSNQEKLLSLQSEPLRRFAFGSCNDQTRDQSYWDIIGEAQPQLWIWLGDNIYADRANLGDRRQWYQLQKANPYYQRFCAQVPMIGTWDDHDYWNENADASYPEKDGSKAIMLEFLDVPQNDPVHRRAGVYQSYEIGPVGQRTQIILLDLRYFQDRNRSQRQLLGADQWSFLEAEIAKSTADLLVIGSSLNVCSPIAALGLEGWQAFGQERQRLFQLLASNDIPTILLSGDRHFGEFYRIILDNGKPVYEVMSSGLTHAVGVKLPNRWRQGEMVGRKNFATLEIDWTGTGPAVQMQLRSTERSDIYGQLQSQFSIL